MNKHRFSAKEVAFNNLFSHYKAQAKFRKREFFLTKKQFRKLIKGNCSYCGNSPFAIWQYKYRSSNVVYNGIDRVDSNKGYTVDNCVSCCQHCNYMKRSFTLDEFINHVKKVYNFLI